MFNVMRERDTMAHPCQTNKELVSWKRFVAILSTQTGSVNYFLGLSNFEQMTFVNRFMNQRIAIEGEK